jgi:hypothetical protein
MTEELTVEELRELLRQLHIKQADTERLIREITERIDAWPITRTKNGGRSRAELVRRLLSSLDVLPLIGRCALSCFRTHGHFFSACVPTQLSDTTPTKPSAWVEHPI